MIIIYINSRMMELKLNLTILFYWKLVCVSGNSGTGKKLQKKTELREHQHYTRKIEKKEERCFFWVDF